MHLLIAEDHADIAASLRDYLTALGHSVDWHSDGAQALAAALIRDFDVIVLDRMLPTLDGASICRQIRQHKRTPVLMLTALDSLDDKLSGFDAGADDYLAKPFALSELRARVDALHRRASPLAPSSVLTLGELSFDIAAMEARRCGRPLSLNPTTRKLLERLMRNAPSVVSRQALEECVWGNEPPPEDVLRIHMHALRASIDKPFSHKMLLTVHGVGYRLVQNGG
jgi:DNA-binding response OmpR family regulator